MSSSQSQQVASLATLANQSTIYNRHERRHLTLRRKYPKHNISSVPLSFFEGKGTTNGGSTATRIADTNQHNPDTSSNTNVEFNNTNQLCDKNDFLLSAKQLDNDVTTIFNNDNNAILTTTTSLPSNKHEQEQSSNVQQPVSSSLTIDTPLLQRRATTKITKSTTTLQYLSYITLGCTSLYIGAIYYKSKTRGNNFSGGGSSSGNSSTNGIRTGSKRITSHTPFQSINCLTRGNNSSVGVVGGRGATPSVSSASLSASRSYYSSSYGSTSLRSSVNTLSVLQKFLRKVVK